MSDASRPAVRITSLGRDRSADLLALDQWAFGLEVDENDPVEPLLDTLSWDRCFGAQVPAPLGDEERLAGIYAAYSTQCPLPGGGTVPAAGLTWVGVHPRDRRRGVLTAMMSHHLEDVRTRRGEPFSLLYAAEPAIYGRFGYGLASMAMALKLSRGAALRDVPGAGDLVVDLEVADADRHADLLDGCYRAFAATRPGCLSRPEAGNRRRALHDAPQYRRGAETLRLLTVRAPDGELRGYALFRRRMRWDFSPDGVVEVREVIARDAAAGRAVWGCLTDLDLTSTVETPCLAVDDPLLHLLVDPRAAAPRLFDALWVRLVDVPAALAVRRYAAGVDAVLEVTDSALPSNAGRWRLRGGPDGATCERATDGDEPHLTLDVRELGSAYLGGISLAALAASGLVTVHDAGALAAVATAFSSPVAPWCAWEF